MIDGESFFVVFHWSQPIDLGESSPELLRILEEVGALVPVSWWDGS